MGESVTNIIATIRSQADSSGGASTGFRTDAQILKLMQIEWSELYNLLVKKNERLFTTHTSGATDITLVSGTREYSLPSTSPAIRKLCGVDLLTGTNEYTPLGPIEWEGRHSDPLLVYELMVGVPTGYILVGSTIMFVPTPTAVGTVRLWYIPNPTTLVESAPGTGQISSMPDVVTPGWESVIIDGVTSRLWSAQGDTELAAHFFNLKMAKKQEIIEEVSNRDMNRPRSVQMVRRRRVL
jgi:hypothetical protein